MNLKFPVLRSLKGQRRGRLLLSLSAVAIVTVALVASLGSLALAADDFPDVGSTHPYYNAISELADRSIIGGYTDGRFGPGDPVRRQQFAKMIVLTGGYPVSEANVCPFNDVVVSGPDSFYPDNYVAVCAANGITLGRTETTFDPYAYITRYQVISMVVRTADNLQSGLLPNPPSGWTGAWDGDPTHGANAARAQYNGLLDGIDLVTLSPFGNMTRGEVAQVLYNLLDKLDASGPVAVALSTTTSPGAGGTVQRSPNQLAYPVGTDVTLTAVPATGYVFHHWDGDATGTTNPVTVTMDTAKSVTAFFAPAAADEDYEDAGGTLNASPSLASPSKGTLYALTRAGDGGIAWKTYFDGSWDAWESIGGKMKTGSRPAAVWRFAFACDVFVRGTNDHLYWKSYRLPDWADWQDMGGSIMAGDPAACAVEGNEVAVFWRNTSGQLVVRRLKDNSTVPITMTWSGIGSVNGSSSVKMMANSSPACVSPEVDGNIDVFIQGTDKHLYHTHYNVNTHSWSSFEDTGFAISSSPAVASWEKGHFVVVWRGAGNVLYYTMTSNGGTTWKTPAKINDTPVVGDPAAISRPGTDEEVDVVVRGTNNHLLHTWFDGTKWRP